MKKDPLLIFWAFVYRLTGYYSCYAERAEYRYVQSRIRVIEWVYASMIDDWDSKMEGATEPRLELAISMEVGMWQIEHGFYRSIDKKRFFGDT